jgi:hypothetical protein
VKEFHEDFNLDCPKSPFAIVISAEAHAHQLNGNLSWLSDLYHAQPCVRHFAESEARIQQQ